MKQLQEISDALSPALQHELLDFALFLKSRKQIKPGKQHIRQTWAGALRMYRGKFTSVSLAEKATEWRLKNE